MIEATEEPESMEGWIEQRREFIRLVEAMTPEARKLLKRIEARWQVEKFNAHRH